jgi:hypothetical protein
MGELDPGFFGRSHEPARTPLLAAGKKAHGIGFLSVSRRTPRRMGAAARLFLMHPDVIELAETALKLLEGTSVSPLLFGMTEQAFEEIAAISKLFDRNAQLVAPASVELLQPFRLLEDFPGAMLQNVRRN